MTVEIRPFAEADRVPCQRIAAVAAMSSYGPRLDATVDVFRDDQPLEDCDWRLVAVVAGRVAGLIDMIGGHVSNLFVDPACQGQGVGSRLMAAAEERVEGDLTLSVFTVNPDARRFYERLGFVLEGTSFTDFAGGRHELWRMRKPRG